MIAATNHTAVLLFSRTAAAEARAKNFFALQTQKHNRRLAQALINHATQVAQQSALPFFICTEQNQQGNSFGERLAGAINTVFSKGYEKVVVIGNDCPTLTAVQLTAAAAQLQQNKLVLSPTKKGGLSLIGTTKECFDATSFAALPWQTSAIAEEVYVWGKKNMGEVVVLSTADDINNSADVYRYLTTHSKHSALYTLINSLVLSLPSFCYWAYSSNYNFKAFRLFGLRAPPFF